MSLGAIKVGILVVSDTAASGQQGYDKSGPAIASFFEGDPEKWIISVKETVVDELPAIQTIVRKWCDAGETDLIITTGGTGFAGRDAIGPLLTKNTPGITHLLLATSLNVTPFAALSRPVSGIRNQTMIITLPGSPKACKENLEAVMPILGHAIDLLRGGKGERIHKALAQEGTGTKSHVHENPEVNVTMSTHGHYFHNHSHHHHHHHHKSHGQALTTSLNEPVARRARKSPYPMLAVEQAQDIIAQYTSCESIVEWPVDSTLHNMILAEDVFAKEPVPGYRASIVDGYAVIAKDGKGTYPVAFVSLAAGSDGSKPLQPGQIARITTGGAVPPGADAIVMVEDTLLKKASEDGKIEELVEICVEAKQGQNIREIGSDCQVNELVGVKGSIVSAVGGEIGLFTSVGVSKVKVYKKPIIGIMSTGTEVIDLKDGTLLGYGQIRDSNRPTLLAATASNGFQSVDLAITPDNVDDLENALRKATTECDVVITTGGVSMGEMDLLKPTLEQKLGATIHFGRVMMKPGKPTTFATVPKPGNEHPTLFFALPGNPVSATVTFYLFVLPALRRMAGYPEPDLPLLDVKLEHSVRLDPRPEYHRAILRRQRQACQATTFSARSTGIQQSSRMLSLSGANALLVLPAREEGKTALEAGSHVPAIIIGQI